MGWRPRNSLQGACAESHLWSKAKESVQNWNVLSVGFNQVHCSNDQIVCLDRNTPAEKKNDIPRYVNLM